MKYIFLLLTALSLLFTSCNKNENERSSGNNEKAGFSWHDGIKPGEAPDFLVKGYIDGKEVQFPYINFEKWRGSKDNVINFSLVKPVQQCGYVEGFTGFVLINKGNPVEQSGFLKSKFADDPKTYQAYFKSGNQRSSAAWNCELVIESMDENQVAGKIAMFFNDEKKSWVAGKFTAVVCNN